MSLSGHADTADVIVVGGGTVGAWCAYFLRRDGLRVILLEKGMLGQGASSRAAGVVRAQRDELGFDSGFVAQGYLLPCFTEAEVTAARGRMAMQLDLGVDVEWLSPDEVDERNPTLAPGQTLGGTFCPDDGYISPPRNVTAYAVALARSGVVVREQVRFLGLRHDGDRVTGADTAAGPMTAGA